MARNAKAVDWTAEQDAVLTLEWRIPETSAGTIAKTLGHPVKAVEYRAKFVLSLGRKPPKVSPWNDETTAASFLELWKRPDLSLPAIAKILRLSTNTLRGRARRLGLPPRQIAPGPKPQAKADPKPKLRKKRPELIFCGSGALVERSESYKPPEDWNPKAWEPLPGIDPVPFIELKRGRCKWPIGDSSGAEMLCCGAVATERAYCKAHARRAYYTPPKPAPKEQPAEVSNAQMLRRVA